MIHENSASGAESPLRIVLFIATLPAAPQVKSPVKDLVRLQVECLHDSIAVIDHRALLDGGHGLHLVAPEGQEVVIVLFKRLVAGLVTVYGPGLGGCRFLKLPGRDRFIVALCDLPGLDIGIRYDDRRLYPGCLVPGISLLDRHVLHLASGAGFLALFFLRRCPFGR
jgi:hypothetical protein